MENKQENKQTVAQSVHKSIAQQKEKIRQQRESAPLCHQVFHPFLGNGMFRPICPICGFSVEEKKP